MKWINYIFLHLITFNEGFGVTLLTIELFIHVYVQGKSSNMDVGVATNSMVAIIPVLSYVDSEKQNFRGYNVIRNAEVKDSC